MTPPSTKIQTHRVPQAFTFRSALASSVRSGLRRSLPLNLCVFLSFAALTLPLCTEGLGADAVPTKVPSNVLRIQIAGDPVSLDPMLAEDTLSTRILANTQDGLVGYSPEGSIEPRVATRWEISEDQKTYRFFLRLNAKWSDGKPVGASDFVSAFKRALTPSSKARFVDLFMAIRGAEAYHTGKGAWNTVGIRTSSREGSEVLEIELERPASHLLAALTLPVANPIRDDILRANGGQWPPTGPSSGRYFIQRLKQEERIDLEINPYHWSLSLSGSGPKTAPLTAKKTDASQRAIQGPTRVELWIVPTESKALELFNRGELDVLTKLSARDFPALQSKNELKRIPLASTYFLGFNLDRMPFKDRNFRRAVAGVLEREALLNELGSGDAPARYWIPPGLEGHLGTQKDVSCEPQSSGKSPAKPRGRRAKKDNATPPPKICANPGPHPALLRNQKGPGALAVDPVFSDSVEKIRTLLSRRTIPLLTATYDTAHKNAVVMNTVQRQLRQNLDLKIQLSTLDWKAYIKQLHQDPPSLFRLGWQAPIPDPLPHLQVFTTGNAHNYVRWSNPHYDALVSQIAQLPSGPLRAAKVEEAQRLLIDQEAIIVPIFHYVQFYAVSPRIRHFPMNVYGILRYDAIELSPKESSYSD